MTCEDRTPEIAGQVVRWLTDEACYQGRVRELDELKRRHAIGGASSRAATYILRHLDPDTPPLAGPHFGLAKRNEGGKRGTKTKKSA
jgi:hypothetical protein